MNEIAKRIRERREQLQISQAELARRVGISQVSVHMYENGETTPKLTIATKLASELGTTCEELVNGKESNYVRTETYHTDD